MATSFVASAEDGVREWCGDPDCQAAHEALLGWLKDNCKPFRRVAEAKSDDNILRGNVGESIAFCVSLWHDCADHRVFATNACRPFRPKSDIDIDILWLSFGKQSTQDFAIIQEVKTTSGLDLAYATTVVEDYEKLFGTNTRLTLNTRLQDVKTDLRFKLSKEEALPLCRRVSKLAGQSPKTCSKIQLRPTLVHELKGTKPNPKMMAVRTTLIGKGWSADAVETWAIGLTDLDALTHSIGDWTQVACYRNGSTLPLTRTPLLRRFASFGPGPSRGVR